MVVLSSMALLTDMQPTPTLFPSGIQKSVSSATTVLSYVPTLPLVFLPAGGYRDIKIVSLVGEYGCYWTSTYYDHLSARELYMYHTGYDLSTAARSNGHSVRLVQDN